MFGLFERIKQFLEKKKYPGFVILMMTKICIAFHMTMQMIL